MAKGNLILGTMSGKLGDVVAYTNNGKQCARVRRRVVTNPNSAGQRVQRMILSTVAQAVSNLRPVLNNAFEGVQKGAPSLAFARSLYMKMLRTENMFNADNGQNYVAKGGQYFAPNAYMVSRGSLGVVSASWVQAEYAISGMFGATLSDTLTASQLFPNAAVGMQHTFIFVEVFNEPGQVGVIRTKVHMCRFVFKDDTTPALQALGDGNFKLNPAALDLDYSAGYTNLSFSLSGVVMATWSGSAEPLAAAYILSTRDGSKRATSYMVYSKDDIDALGTWSPDAVVETYESGGVDSGAPAEYLLDDNPGGSF